MKQLIKRLPKPSLRHVLVAGLLVATGSIIVLTRGDTASQIQTNRGMAAATDQTRPAGTGSPTNADSSTMDGSSGGSTESASSGGTKDKQASDPKAESPACAALTLKSAQKILGQKTSAAKPVDMSDLSATNTSLSACAYANGSARIQVTVRTPDDNLGVSKNATIFGSGRPTNAVGVDGLGQSAFWDPDTHRLNILHSNIWYLVQLDDNATQSATEAAADQLAVKL